MPLEEVAAEKSPELIKRGGVFKQRKKMIILFYNIRGLGSVARGGQLKEVIKEKRVYIICLQETKKEVFLDRELNSFQGGRSFVWC